MIVGALTPGSGRPGSLGCGRSACRWSRFSLDRVARGARLLATQLLFFVIHFRSDCYGGSFENYVRFVVVATEAMRAALPDDVVLSVRVSSTVWGTGGWTIEETVELAFRVPRTGADLIDCGAGGIAAKAPVPLGSGHEEPFAERARHEAGVPTTAVALITEPTKTDAIVRNWQADWVLKGRGDPCAIQTGH